MASEAIIEEFQAIGVSLNSDWLAGIEVVHDGPLTNDIVYQALTVSDLRESCTVSQNHPLSLLAASGASRFPDGAFLFQMTAVQDISIPNAQRPRMVTSSKRIFEMVLDYGDLSFRAIENEPITVISDIPDAGLKVIISGSPDIVEGVVFLGPNNIHIVGGDVRELVRNQKLDIEMRVKSRDVLEACHVVPLREIQNR